MNVWMKRGAVAVSGLLGLGAVGVGGLVAYVKTADPRYDDVPAPEIHASTDPAVIEQGAYIVYAVAHCTDCHGAREKGDHTPKAGRPPLTGGQPIVTPFGTYFPSNITPDETGIAAYSDAELARVIRHAVDREGRMAAFMKVAVGPMSDEDLTAVVSYLRTVPATKREVPPSEPNLVGNALVAFEMFQPAHKEIPPYAPGGSEPTVERGAYLARGPANCVGCHTEADPTADFTFVRPEFSGGGPHMSENDPSMAFVPPNLTPHEGGIVASWTEDRFVERFRQGRTYPDTIMPWENFGQMTEADLRSIYRFLRSLPPDDHDPGPSYGPTP